MGEYIVSLRVSFETPRGIEAKSEAEAKRKAKSEFARKLKAILDDWKDLEIEVEYAERTDY